MGSSTKKKKEKQKDFQKAKLKVGKTKAKPENFTDTSFKTKSITLTQQSLTLSAPTSSSQFTHHLSLTTSKSDTQRRDSLAHLTSALTNGPVNKPPPQPTSTILPPLLPLMLDSSAAVRTQLLKLLRALPAADIPDHVVQLLPYVRAAMTHLAADIRMSAVDVLSWMVEVAGAEVVSCAGGWIKTLNCFLSLLGWHTEESARWSSSRASYGKGGKEVGARRVMGVLGEVLDVGLGGHNINGDGDGNGEGGKEGEEFPITTLDTHMVPTSAAPYVYLNLFGAPRDEEGEMYETPEDRYRVFETRFLAAVRRGLESARSEGGEMGRASAGVSKVVKEAVRRYSPGK